MSIYSEIEEVILIGSSKLAHVYPNPTSDKLMLEILESFNEDVEIDIISTNGVVLGSVFIPVDTPRKEVDFQAYPAGTYFIRLRFGGTDVKVIKVIKQ